METWRTCKTHGPEQPNAWGCPECVRELREENNTLRSAVEFSRRRCDALQACQSTMRDPERTMVCDILANGHLLAPEVAGDRYALREED